MKDWFEWNGVRCTDYGIHVTELPPITLPNERLSFVDVPGRAGSLAKIEGEDVYDDLLLTATCVVQNTERLGEIAVFLKGSGTVSFANREKGVYYARIINQIPFESILRGNSHRRFVVNFRCKLFFYLDDSPTYTLSRSNSLTNPGAVYSEPVITVYGRGDTCGTHSGVPFTTKATTALADGLFSMETVSSRHGFAWMNFRPFSEEWRHLQRCHWTVI